MVKRLYNFNPGPAALPLPVLQEAASNFVEYDGRGISLMEVSHRSQDVEVLNGETQALLRELLAVPEDTHILFMGGGASAQFAILPMNFLRRDQMAGYVLSGSFSEKAFHEAETVGTVTPLASSKDRQWAYIPDLISFNPPANMAYVHLTANNTIEGSQFVGFPDTKGVPLVADMTSDILSRRRDLSQFSLVYAGAQKNLGPAGITVVIVTDDFLMRAAEHIPAIFQYKTFAKSQSLYNTPPVHALYMMNRVLKWVKGEGGIESLERRNREKAKLIYDVIDGSDGFYQGCVDPPYRSLMNITWRLRSAALEDKFIQMSEGAGFVGLAGHRSVGGIRASAYNAVPLAACEALAEWMTSFRRQHV